MVAIPIGADSEGSRWADIRLRAENAKRAEFEPAMPMRKRSEVEEVLWGFAGGRKRKFVRM